MAQEKAGIKERQDIKLKEPKRYLVFIHNDDFTTMDFVVKVLIEVFFKSEEEAEALMLKVHHEGKTVVGIYTYDIAKSKVDKANDMAHEVKYPLRLTIEPEG